MYLTGKTLSADGFSINKITTCNLIQVSIRLFCSKLLSPLSFLLWTKSTATSKYMSGLETPASVQIESQSTRSTEMNTYTVGTFLRSRIEPSTNLSPQEGVVVSASKQSCCCCCCCVVKSCYCRARWLPSVIGTSTALHCSARLVSVTYIKCTQSH